MRFVHDCDAGLPLRCEAEPLVRAEPLLWPLPFPAWECLLPFFELLQRDEDPFWVREELGREELGRESEPRRAEWPFEDAGRVLPAGLWEAGRLKCGRVVSGLLLAAGRRTGVRGACWFAGSGC